MLKISIKQNLLLNYVCEYSRRRRRIQDKHFEYKHCPNRDSLAQDIFSPNFNFQNIERISMKTKLFHQLISVHKCLGPSASLPTEVADPTRCDTRCRRFLRHSAAEPPRLSCGRDAQLDPLHKHR